MDDTNEESLSHELTGTDEQFHSQDSLADVNNAGSSLPSVTEMLAVISESTKLAQNLQDLILSSPGTSQNSHNPMISTLNSTESKGKEELAEFDSTSPSDSRTTAAAEAATTTNLTCYDKNFQPLNIKLLHRESLKFNVEVTNCENVAVGDYAEVNIYYGQKGPVNQTASSRSREFRLNENSSLVQADGDINLAKLSKKKKKKRLPSATNSKTNKEPGKIKTKWRFPLNLSDFTDTESLHNSIDQWLVNVISSLLPEAQDLDDFESLIKLLEESMKLRVSSVPNCILKLGEAIQAMSDLVGNEDGGKYNVLLTETQFVLAEFYTKEGNYLSALDCLRTLEASLRGETQKSRLYAKIAKVMEHCLDDSVDFTVDENKHEGANTSVSNLNPDEVVLSYYEKALNFSNKEPSEEKQEIIQRCCYLGIAAVHMRLWKGQIETVRNLSEVRQNLSSTEGLFNRISPDMKCQFYLAEAFLLYYEGGHQMAAEMKIQKAYKIADEEHFLKRKCLGSKRLHFLLAELNKSTDISAEVGGEILDVNSVEG